MDLPLEATMFEIGMNQETASVVMVTGALILVGVLMGASIPWMYGMRGNAVWQGGLIGSLIAGISLSLVNRG